MGARCREREAHPPCYVPALDRLKCHAQCQAAPALQRHGRDPLATCLSACAVDSQVPRAVLAPSLLTSGVPRSLRVPYPWGGAGHTQLPDMRPSRIRHDFGDAVAMEPRLHTPSLNCILSLAPHSPSILHYSTTVHMYLMRPPSLPGWHACAATGDGASDAPRSRTPS